MPPAARVTDPTTHGGPLAPGPGSTNVLIGDLPAWRAVIDQHACPAVSITGPDGVGSVELGSPTVLINNMMACRLGDIVIEKPGLAMGPADPIIMGEPTVEIGEVGMGSPVVVTPLPPLVILAQAMASPATQAVSNSAQDLAQAAQDGTPEINLTLANQPLAAAAGAPVAAGTGPFASQDGAARAALQVANPESIKANREYAGLIYRGADGQYYYTGPIQGSDQGANPHAAPVPPGGAVVGDYHTHGDYSTADPATGAAVRTSDPKLDDFNSDGFSTTDKSGIASDGAGVPGYAGYLGTPSGTFRKYDPATGSDTTL
jgi:uncharacterized Zn-binding protein involved in type VI secretion